MSLPRFIALESASVGKFVHFVAEEGDTQAVLRAFGETIISPYAKFEVERARSGGALVNIRCCYNNKYWVRTTRRNDVWIGCDATEPQEDTSLWTTTLFEPIFTTANNQNYVRLKFAFEDRYVNAGNSYQNQLQDNDLTLASTIGTGGLFSVFDWEMLCILPKYVVFKGENGQFLSARTIERESYLQFASDDIGDSTVGNEVFPLRDGAIRLRSNHFGRFWRRSPNWIRADSNDNTTNNLDTVFRPIRVRRNVVALRNLGNNNFCKRLTAEGKTSCLNAAVDTIDLYARLEVHESVLYRDISNVSYRLMDARIYGQTVLAMATGDAVNRSTEPNSISLRLLYSETEIRSFNSSVTLKLGVETTIKTGIPIIVSGEITISAEIEGRVEWGTTTETRKEMETTYVVTVPPMTELKVRLLATRGRCDVPFSYTQRDMLTNGQTVTTIMNDGVYTGANSFNFTYETDKLPLSRCDEPLPLSSSGGLLASSDVIVLTRARFGLG